MVLLEAFSYRSHQALPTAARLFTSLCVHLIGSLALSQCSYFSFCVIDFLKSHDLGDVSLKFLVSSLGKPETDGQSDLELSPCWAPLSRSSQREPPVAGRAWISEAHWFHNAHSFGSGGILSPAF